MSRSIKDCDFAIHVEKEDCHKSPLFSLSDLRVQTSSVIVLSFRKYALYGFCCHGVDDMSEIIACGQSGEHISHTLVTGIR